MTQSTLRRAASAGVVAASLLIVGPNPAQAVADKHGSGSYSKNDDRKNASNRLGNGPVRRVSDFVNGVLNPGSSPDNGPKPDLSPPLMELGTGGNDLEDLAVVESLAPEGQIALRSAAVADEPVGGNAAGAAPRAGSGYAAPPAAAVRCPTRGDRKRPVARSPRPHDRKRAYARDLAG